MDSVAPAGVSSTLEVFPVARALAAPWMMCPMTTDLHKAREWLEDWTDVSRGEGLDAEEAMQQR